MLSRETEILALPPCLARHPRLEHGPTAGESPVVAPGEVAEWSNAPHSKCGIGASLSGVRIPPSPPYRPKSSDFSALPEVGYLTAHIPAHTCDRTANELLGRALQSAAVLLAVRFGFNTGLDRRTHPCLVRAIVCQRVGSQSLDKFECCNRACPQFGRQYPGWIDLRRGRRRREVRRFNSVETIFGRCIARPGHECRQVFRGSPTRIALRAILEGGRGLDGGRGAMANEPRPARPAAKKRRRPSTTSSKSRTGIGVTRSRSIRSVIRSIP
jgi:hypothetical protein